jgi:hypothetical protein
MTWTDPTTRSTGDLITAAIWNQDVVDNLEYLHDRAVIHWIPPQGVAGGFGDWYIINCYSAAFYAYFSFIAPPDFDQLESLEVAILGTQTGQRTFDLNSDYGNPDDAEDYDHHTEALTGQTEDVILDEMEWIDVSGVFSSLAAGDVCSLKMSGNYQYMYILGCRMRYTRTGEES